MCPALDDRLRRRWRGPLITERLLDQAQRRRRGGGPGGRRRPSGEDDERRTEADGARFAELGPDGYVRVAGGQPVALLAGVRRRCGNGGVLRQVDVEDAV